MIARLFLSLLILSTISTENAISLPDAVYSLFCGSADIFDAAPVKVDAAQADQEATGISRAALACLYFNASAQPLLRASGQPAVYNAYIPVCLMHASLMSDISVSSCMHGDLLAFTGLDNSPPTV